MTEFSIRTRPSSSSSRYCNCVLSMIIWLSNADVGCWDDRQFNRTWIQPRPNTSDLASTTSNACLRCNNSSSSSRSTQTVASLNSIITNAVAIMASWSAPSPLGDSAPKPTSSRIRIQRTQWRAPRRRPIAKSWRSASTTSWRWNWPTSRSRGTRRNYDTSERLNAAGQRWRKLATRWAFHSTNCRWLVLLIE